MAEIRFRPESEVIKLLDALIITGLFGRTHNECAEQLMLDQLKHLLGTPLLQNALIEREGTDHARV